MQEYSLKNEGIRAGKKKGTSAKLAPIHAPLSIEIQYYRAENEILKKLSELVKTDIIPRYQYEYKTGTLLDAQVNDVDASWFDNINNSKYSWIAAAMGSIGRIIREEGRRHTRKFSANIKQVMGIDLSAVIRDEDIEGLLKIATSYSASLVTNMTDDAIKRIESAVYSATINGDSVTNLRKTLQEQLGISQRRAKLIARDQTSKLYGDMDRIRQTQAGITSYEWLASMDERTRPLHASYNGRTFKWSEPPSDGHPGSAINCRCVAIGKVEF